MRDLDLSMHGDYIATNYVQEQKKIIQYLVLAIFSIFYYLMYHGQVNLHDIAHYIVSGVSIVRDRAELIYPYSSMDPGSKESVYSFFQDNARLLDLRRGYPSKLYSSLFGLQYLLTGSLSFYFAHIVSAAAILGANFFLYAISLRFFAGIVRPLFVLTIAFTPVVGTAVCPGNDSIGFFFSALILWACLCSKFSPVVIGILIGIFSHFRSQIIFLLFIIPFLLIFLHDKKLLLRKIIAIAFGGLCIYIAIDVFFKIWIDADEISGGGLDFYLKHFLGSFYGLHEFKLVIEKFIHNILNLGGINYLYIFIFISLIAFISPASNVQKGLSFSALMIIFFPLVIYSFDRFSDPHPRYYVGSVPFMVLSCFLLMLKISKKYCWLNINYISILFFLAVLIPWLNIYGLPISNIVSFSTISHRLTFLDFKDVSKILSSNFLNDDLIITNHALPSGLTKLNNFISCPSYSEFMMGDNNEVDGIVFVYANSGSGAFFKPVEWMQEGELPSRIVDNQGCSFHKICTIQSTIANSEGEIDVEANFVIYKNFDNHRFKYRDMAGKRIFQTKVHTDLTELRIRDGKFENPQVWNGMLVVPEGDPYGAVVGPGPNNPNVLSQRFSVMPGEALRLVANASSPYKESSEGRLQVNWLDQDGNFLSTEISIFKATKQNQQFRRTVYVPEMANWGIVYVSPHGIKDIVKFSSVDVFGVKSE